MSLLLKKKAMMMTATAVAADIVFVATSDVSITAGNNTTHTVAYSLTNGSGNNRKLVAIGGIDLGDITGFSYNGGTAAEAVDGVDTESTNSTQCIMHYLDGDELPNDTSSHDAVWTTAGSSEIFRVLREYDNVANGAPEDTANPADQDPADVTPATATVTSTEGALVIFALCGGSDFTTDNLTATRYTFAGGVTERVDAIGTGTGANLGVADLVGATAGAVSPTALIDTGQARLGVALASFAKAA